MSEESKIWASLSLLSLLVIFCFAGQYLTSVDAANLALNDSKSRLALIQDQLHNRKKFWSEKEQAVQRLQTENEKNAALLGELEILDQRFHKSGSDFKYILESMQDAVERTRKNAPGTELGDVTLVNGKTLRGVKIRKVEESGISFIHESGIGSIPSDQAPEKLKDQYDLGANALISKVQQAQMAFLQASEADDTNTPPILPAAAPPETPFPQVATTSNPKNPVDEAKIKRIRLRMAELDAFIASYPSLIAQYRQTAASHQALARSAKERGTPSTLHTANANKVLAQAATLEKQLASMREERSKLTVELDYAIMGK